MEVFSVVLVTGVKNLLFDLYSLESGLIFLEKWLGRFLIVSFLS